MKPQLPPALYSAILACYFGCPISCAAESLQEEKTGINSVSSSPNEDGFCLNGETIIVNNAEMFGSENIELINGTLDLNGYTINNAISVSEGANVIVKNGITTGDYELKNADSFTADNFRVLANKISMQGDEETSTVRFTNLTVQDSRQERYEGGYLRASELSICGMTHLSFDNSTIESSNENLYGGLIYGSYGSTINLNVNDNFDIIKNTVLFSSDSTDLYGGLIFSLGSTINIAENGKVNINQNNVTSTRILQGGLITCSTLNVANNMAYNMTGNTVDGFDMLWGGLIDCYYVNMVNNKTLNISDNVTTCSTSWLGAGMIGAQTVLLRDNESVKINNNEAKCADKVIGGCIDASSVLIQGNTLVQMMGNIAISTPDSSGEYTDGGVISSSANDIKENDTVIIHNNRAECTKGKVRGGAIYAGIDNSAIYGISITGNKDVHITRNAAVSDSDAIGGAIYSNSGVRVANNKSVILRGNYEQMGNEYRLRSIYTTGNMELSANAEQKISIYDSVYVGENLILNDEGTSGEIILSGAYTEVDLLAIKGIAGTTAETKNSKTNLVGGTTILGGGLFRLEYGAILQTGGFIATADSDAQMWMVDSALNSTGYDVSFGSGNGFVVGGSNLLSANNFNMQEGSYMSFDLRAQYLSKSSLMVNANMSINGLDIVIMNADIMAAGKYKLLTLEDETLYDIDNWNDDIKSVTGVDASSLNWENGTLYYTSTNNWIISVTEDSSINQDTTGADIVISNGATVEITTNHQGHQNCDNPKHGSRPDYLGQNNAKPTHDNSVNKPYHHDAGDGNIVIVEGAAHIRDNGQFAGVLSFRGNKNEERYLYAEKNLNVPYIVVQTDSDAASYLHIKEGCNLETEGIVGAGNIVKQGAGVLELNGYDNNETSSLYFGCLGVEEGTVRIENGSQAYIASSEIDGRNTSSILQVGKDATMTGERITVIGDNSTLHNDGKIVMDEGVTVNGGIVKGCGSFPSLTMNGGTLIVGNSPGQQVFLGDVTMKDCSVVFSLAEASSLATHDMYGWDASVNSVIDMGGNALTLSETVNFVLEIGGDALERLVTKTGNTLAVEMILIQNIGALNTEPENMATIFDNLTVIITKDVDGLSKELQSLAGKDITESLSLCQYQLVSAKETSGVSNLVFSATLTNNGSLTVPEPSSATLSLIALACLAARRKRK